MPNRNKLRIKLLVEQTPKFFALDSDQMRYAQSKKGFCPQKIERLRYANNYGVYKLLVEQILSP